ncbi:MAG: hypothetical protein U0T79_04365 [Ferruginibacter sp.]
MRRLSLMLLTVCFAAVVNAQNVTVSGALVGNGSYATLAAAFTAINGGAQTGATITITIDNSTTEPAAGAILNAGAWTSVSIQPAGGAARTISGAATAGSPLIDFNGADNVTVNGLNSGGNSLTIENTTVSATSGTATIRFIGGATGNTITNCSVKGAGTMSVATNGAVIFFSTDANTTNGNDNNTISNCDIGPSGANLPTKAILGNGSTTTTAIGNSGIVITNNDIHDFFGAAVTSSGVATNGGCNTWTITNNRFYQTGTRTWTTGATHRAIDINNTTATSGAQGFTITGNIIGYASNTQTGTYTLTGSTGKFQGIQFNGITLGTVSNINNNTVASVSLTGVTSSGTSTSTPFIGILVTNGVANTNNNSIGSQSATGSLTFSTNTTTATDVMGIYNFSTDVWTATGNNIGGISVTNAGASGTFVLYGMRANTGTGVAMTATSNNIGGTVANSLQLTSTGTSSQVIGLHTSNAPAVFTSNTIRNLTNNNGTGTTTSASVIGINITTSTPNHTVSQNTIHSLSNTNTTAATTVTGIQFTGSTANVVERNLIYGLTSATNSATAEINGIRVAGGTTTYRNNMIVLGAGVSNAIGGAATNSSTAGINGFNGALGTDNFWHNSIYIGGTATAGTGASYAFNGTQTVNTRSFRNNIFVNARANSGATGKNYAIKLNGTVPNPTGLTINNNLYYITGSGTVFGFYNSLDVADLNAWKAAVGQDANSYQSDPQYIDPTNATPNLHINAVTPTQVEGNGAALGVTNDYDGDLRASFTPEDIGADAGNFTASGDINPPNIVYTPLTFTCSTGDRALNGVTITDASGVPTAGALQPRVYYKKGLGGTWFSSQGTLASGSGTNGTWNFTIVAADMGGVAAGDVIYYYVIAQDIAGTPNIAANPGVGLVATDVNTVTTPPTTPNNYSISNTLSGTYNVGTGQTYTTIGAAIAAYNSSCLGGPVTFLLTDASYAGETLPLTINANPDANSTNTLTIKPSLSNTTISGSSASAVFILNGADYVTINGSISGTSNSICPPVSASRDLTISNTNTGTSSAVIWLQTNVADGATNNAIRNCNIVGNASTTTLVGIGSGSSTIGTSSLGTGNNNNSFENNNIRAVQVGIYSQGASAANKNTGTNIKQNQMNFPSGFNQNIRTAAVFVGFENNINISGNNIGSVIGSGADGFGIACGSIGISTTTFTGNEVINATITNNRIDSIRGASTFSASGIYIVTSTNAGTNLIANNVIANTSINGTSGDFGSGIFIGGGAVTTNVYYNSVSITGTFTGGNQPNFALAIGGSNPVVDVRNNAFYATAVNGGGTALGIGAYAVGYGYSTFTSLTSNNNDYFTAGTEAKFAKTGSLASAAGTDVANLAALQAATAQDAASISVDPLFNGLSILVPQIGSPLVGAGAPAGGITTDFLCATRSGSTPTIGAYEAAADVNPPVISYTLLTGSCSTGDRPLNGVTITDVTGVPTAGALQPRVYYRKNAGTWFSSQGTLASGSGTNGTWNFTIVAADMGGLTGGDVIQYYVIAQDLNGNITSNPSFGLVATDVNTVTSAPSTPNSTTVGATLNGTYTVGAGGNYTTLTAAINAYNTGCLTGPVVFELTDANYSTNETFPISIGLNNDASATNTLTIRPTGTATITGTNGTSLITFNGARYVTIDGRIGSTGTTHSLTIANTTGAAVVLINDANNNTVKYSDLKSDNTSTTSGVVLFSTTTGANGNDNNTIDNCNIGPNAANPTNGIFSSGTTTSSTHFNSGNVISNNNIFDFYNSTSTSNGGTGLNVSSGNTDWSVTGNSFYQTATRTTYGAAAVVSAINISNTAGSNFTVTGNYVGGTAPLCAGTAYTINATTTVVFRGILISVGVTPVSNVTSNTVRNLSITTTSASTAQSAFSVQNGGLNVDGNTIGSQSATGDIVFSTSGTSAIFSAFLVGNGTTGQGVINITNNNVGGISVTGAGTTSLRGISFQSSGIVASTQYTVTGNTIGGTVANSIQNSTNASILGIAGFSSQTTSTNSVANNVVRNMTTTGTSTSNTVIGILSQGSTGGIYSTTGNTVSNLSSTSTSTGVGASASVIGIHANAATTAGQTISQNTVFALSNTDAAAAVGVTGINFSGPTTGTNVVSRNLVYNISAASTNVAADVRGINFSSGIANVQNNMVRIGTNIATGVTVTGLYEVGSTANSGIYFNSVYVGGTGVSTETGNSYAFRSDQVTNVRTFQNNIFVNARSNATTGGKHYAVRVAGTAPNPAGLTLNYNDYQATGTGAVFGFFNSLDVADLAAWRTATGQDANSLNADPQYIDPTNSTPDLHIHPTNPTVIEGAGFAIGAVTDDYDGQTRAGLTPTDIGADAGNFTPSDISAPSITYTALTFTCATGDRALNGVTITDASGVPTAGALQPRIYYKKGVGGTWFSSQGTLASGSGTNGTWNFTIVAADMGGVALGDVIYYYVIAQDVLGNIAANPGAGLVATDVNTVTTPPTTPNNYAVSSTLNGTYTVGAGGNYTTLTAAIAAYQASCLGGPVTFSLTDPTYSTGTGETFPLVIAVNADASATNTLTIRPANGVAAAITGTSGASASALIRLNGAKYIIFDGIATGGSSLTVENTSTTAGTTAFWLSSNGAGLGASNNIIRNTIIKAGVSQNTTTTNTYGIIVAGNTLSGTHTSITAGDDNDNNTIQANTFTKVRYGIFVRGGSTSNPNTGTQIINNIIGPSAFGPEQIGKGGIVIREEDGTQITGNEIRFVGGTFANTSAGSDRVGINIGTDAIWSASSAPTTVYVKNAVIAKNKIHDVVDERTFTGAGIIVSAADGANATNNLIANNVIYGIKANGTSGDQTLGIALSAANGDRVVYNSIYLTGDTDPDAGASSPSQSNAGISIAYTAVTNPLVKDNVVYVDLSSSSNTTLQSACINVPASYTWGTGSSNYNDLFRLGTNTQANVGSVGGSTFHNTLAAWQAAVTQDANSISADPLFPSATVLQPGLGTPLIAAGNPVAGVTDDHVGVTRDVATPTIGAYEQAGDFTGPSITYTPLANTGCATDRTLTPVTITDGSGVNITAGTRPRMYFKKSTNANTFNDNTNATDGWKYVEATGAGGSPFDFTTNYALVNGGVTNGDVIQYFIVSQDNAGTPNVGINSGTFAAAPASVALTSAAFPIGGSINSFSIGTPLAADVTIGAAGTYTSITGAGGLFAAINAGGISANITARILDASLAETGSIVLNAISYGCAAGPYTLTIKPDAGVTTAITGSSATSLIKLNGADYVTIDGSNNGSSSRNMTITNTGTGSVVWIGTDATAGATNNTLKNFNMVGPGSFSGQGIIAGSGTTFGAAAENGRPNSNNTVQNLTAKSVQNGIFALGDATTPDQNWLITQNEFGSTVAAEKLSFRGIALQNAQNFTISRNRIFGVSSSTSTSSTMSGILVGSTLNTGTIERNEIFDIKQTNTAGWGSAGIFLNASNTAANVNVQNNLIYDVASYGFDDITSVDNGYGIMVNGGGGYNIRFNSVRMTTDQTEVTGRTAAINISANIVTAASLDIRDNIFANTQTVGNRYAIISEAANSVFANINYNDYFAPVTGYNGTTEYANLAAWQGASAQDVNSVAVDPQYTSTTNLNLLAASPLIGAGTTLAGVTNDYTNSTRNSPPSIGAYEQKIVVSARIFLHGAYSSGLARHKDVTATWAAVLNANALSQPYSIYGYAGTESVTAGFFTSTAGTTDIVDWVLVDLRDAVTPATIISQRAAFVREDGLIVDLDGVSPVSFKGFAAGNYFITIRHRNHLGVRTATTQLVDGAVSPTAYDFSTAQTQAYQDAAILALPAPNNNSAMNSVGGKFVMWGGNGNSNTTTRANGPLAQNDYLFLVTTTLAGNVTGQISNVYSRADYNMDGTVRANGPLAQNDYLFLITTTLAGSTTKIISQHQ